MKRRIVVLLMGLMCVSGAVTAQHTKVIENNYQKAAYHVMFDQPQQHQVVLDGTTYTEVTFDNSTPTTRIGAPNLPVVTQFVEVPICSKVRVSISEVQSLSLVSLKHQMIPVQPAPSKSDTSRHPMVMDYDLYSTDALIGNDTAWVEMMGVARDRNIALLRISPIFYNPTTGAMEMISSMTVTLTYEESDESATSKMHHRYYSPDFSIGTPLLSMLPESDKSVRNAAPLHYLIVAHSMFRGALDSLIAWKKRQGFLVTVGYTDEAAVGTTNTSIANYIKGFYTNASEILPAPTYLLLVGDNGQIPTFNAQCGTPATDHVTDLYYATWSEGDNIPDCYMGRMSASSVQELQPQVSKTIYYERYDFADDSYLNKGILIAGEDRGYSGDNAYTYADPAMDYIAKTYINNTNGFTTVKYYKNNTSFAPTGVAVTGSSQTSASATTLRNFYSEGYGWINYSAHGYDDEWSTPEFTNSHVSSMSNTNKPSIMIGNCCLSGKFNTTYATQCLGEALLRKGNNAGAVAYFGGTNSTYWPQDFYWAVGVRSNISGTMNTSYNANNLGMYDRLFHTHNEDYTQWHNTTGSMNVAGNTAVQANGSYARYYWEIYELFGDPSLMPWLSAADDATVSAPSLIVLGSPTYTVNTDSRAYVAITTAGNHDLVCAAYADASTGTAQLQLPTSLTVGTYELAVWSQGHKPYFMPITVTVQEGDYLYAVSLRGQQNHLTPNVHNTMDVVVTNFGNESSVAGTMTLSCLNDDVNVTSNTQAIGAIAPNDTVRFNGIFGVDIPANYRDGDIIDFLLTISNGDNSNTQEFHLPVTTYRLEASLLSVEPSLSSGEPVTFTCQLSNNGSVVAPAAAYTLTNDFNFIAVPADPINLSELAPGSTQTLVFTLSMVSNLPNIIIPFNLNATVDNVTDGISVFNVNAQSGGIEDFESNGFSSFEWEQGTNPWFTTSDEKHSGDYSARSKNSLSENATSEMSLRWTSTMDDSIRFWYKVSSEQNYDFFYFYIDGDEKLKISGNAGWSEVSYPVVAGTHTFKFEYAKDYSRSSGSDCAWVDDIVLPIATNPCTYTYDTVLQHSVFVFHGDTIPTDRIGHFVYVDSTDGYDYLSLTVVGIGDLQQAVSTQQVSLYPNPTHSRVTIYAADVRSITLVNSLGQTVRRMVNPTDNPTFDVSTLPRGIYFVRVDLPDGVVTKKLVCK